MKDYKARLFNLLGAIMLIIGSICMAHDVYMAITRVPFEEISIRHSNWTLGWLLSLGALATLWIGVWALIDSIVEFRNEPRKY